MDWRLLIDRRAFSFFDVAFAQVATAASQLLLDGTGRRLPHGSLPFPSSDVPLVHFAHALGTMD